MAPVSRKYIATLALVAAAILVVESLLRPSQETTNGAPVLSESDSARLAQLAERRSLDDQTAYFAAVADRARAGEVGRARPAATSDASPFGSP